MTPDRDVDERLADWVDGRMTERERARFEGELRVNAKLRAELAEYERTVALLRRALQSPTQPVSVADRVLVQLASPRTAPVAALRPRRGFGPLGWSLLSAAALMVLAVTVDSWSLPPSTHLVARDGVREGVADPSRPAPVVPAERELADDLAPVTGTPVPPGEGEKPNKGQSPAGGEVRKATQLEEPAMAAAPAASVGAAVAEEERKDKSAAQWQPVPGDSAQLLKKDQVAGRESAAAPPPTLGEPEPLGRNRSEKSRDQQNETRGGPGSPPAGGRGGPATGGPGRAAAGGGASPGPAKPSAPAAPAPGSAAPAPEAATPMIAMLDVEGVQEASREVAKSAAGPEASAKAEAGARVPQAEAAESSQLGASTHGAVPAPLTDEQLQAAVQAFFASRLDAAGPAVEPLADGQAPVVPPAAAQPDGATWQTQRGALQVSAFVVAPPPSGVAVQPEQKTLAPSTVRELAWLVDGDRVDVQLLLGRVGELVRERKWILRSGETPQPLPQRSGVDALRPYRGADGEVGPVAPTSGVPAAAPSVPAGAPRQQIVVRFRLRSR